jgi:predicted permease
VSLFLSVLFQITLPIVLISGLGFVMQRWLTFDVASLNRLVVYVILPCFLVYYLSSASIPLSDVSTTAWFTIAQFGVLMVIGAAVAWLLRMPPAVLSVVALAAAFPNSGNYGLPLVQLAFGQSYVLHQAVIVSLHSILIMSVGVALISHRQRGLLGPVRSAFRTPMIPAVALGILLKLVGLKLPAPIAIPLQTLGSAYTPIALFGLGAQLAMSRWRAISLPLDVGLFLRLLAAPALTWLAVTLIGTAHPVADLLVVISSVPVGVLLSIVCQEYETHGDLASALVFASTVLSPVTVTLVIFLMRLLHGA